MQSTFFVI